MSTIDGRRCPCSAVYLCQRKKKFSTHEMQNVSTNTYSCIRPPYLCTYAFYYVFYNACSTRVRFATRNVLFVSATTCHNYGNAVEFLFAPVTFNATIIPVIAQFYSNNLHGAISARPECSSGYQRAAILSYVCLSTHASKPRLSMHQQWLRSAL